MLKASKNDRNATGIALPTAFLLAMVCEYAKPKYADISGTPYFENNGAVLLCAVTGYLRVRTFSALTKHLPTASTFGQPISRRRGSFGNRHRSN